MVRPFGLLAVLAMCVALATATSTAAIAMPPPTTIKDQNDQRKAPCQSELESNLQRSNHSERTRVAVELFRCMERNFVPDPDIIGDVAAQPPARPVPAVPQPG